MNSNGNCVWNLFSPMVNPNLLDKNWNIKNCKTNDIDTLESNLLADTYYRE